METPEFSSEEHLNFLVDNYKATKSEEFRDKLLSEFSGYFSKYAKLLCGFSQADLKNRDTLKFLRLFLTKDDRIDSKTEFFACRNVVSFLKTLFKDCTYNDIYDEIVCYFLENLERYTPMMTKKHIPDRISFAHFMQVNIRFKLKALVMARQKDALSRFTSVEFNDEIEQQLSEKRYHEYHDIDIRWALGNTASDVFKRLSPIDRYLLYLKFQNDPDKPLSDYTLAKLTGMDRCFIRRKFVRIRIQLKELMN